MSKFKLTNYKVVRINKFTGGKIQDYKMPDDYIPLDELDNGILEDSFVSPNGEYIGNAETGWRYYKKNWIVDNEYPHNVAIEMQPGLTDNQKLTVLVNLDNNTYNYNVRGFVGYTHRGSVLFQLGHRLFDENYEPDQSDFSEEQWEELTNRFDKSKEPGKKLEDFIPFIFRGKNVITTYYEARQAALAFSKYLS